VSGFEKLLEEMVPGASRNAPSSFDEPGFPASLGLTGAQLVARGGYGWVFRAEDPVLERTVAVKISRPDGGAEARKALLEEARLTARLKHPAVLPVHRIVATEGLLCVEYALAPERTLEVLLEDPDALLASPVERRLALLRTVADALARAHDLGIVHGDIHPGNVGVGPSWEPYLLDWSGASAGPLGTFTGDPAYAAPELLYGQPPSPAADVYALGVLVWELFSGRRLRPRRRGEDLGRFVARWRDARPPDAPDPGLTDALAAALRSDPGRRCSCRELLTLLDGALSALADVQHRSVMGEALMAEAREHLLRWHELGVRLVEERRVVLVQSQKIPGHADLHHKRPLWEAEDRVYHLTAERWLTWLRATRQATLAATLIPESRESQATLGELWWERMLDAEGRGDEREAWLAREQVLQADPERKGRTLLAPAHLTLTAETDATVQIARFVEHQRRLVPEVIDQRQLPLERLALPVGSYLITATTAEGAVTRYPVALGRLEHHQNRLRFFSPEQIGEGWVYIPSGPFRLGGDTDARRAVEPCRPTIGDRFMMKTPVTCQQWCAFLDTLPLDEATSRAPGRRGRFGSSSSTWQHTADGWRMPEGWRQDWPIIGVSYHDAVAYAAWQSARSGRAVRLPTEEEWEKAARGVDGRTWPWGNHFDPRFANMARSIPDEPGPVAVGSFPIDDSVFGCLDMAGNAAEWTQSMMDSKLIAVRSGSWQAEPDELRCASRRAVPAHYRASVLTFRLISEQPAGQ
jgi:formylglycine-generating enzyme required for sulfatase activity